MDDEISKISDESVDSSGCYVVFTTVETRRNLQGVDGSVGFLYTPVGRIGWVGWAPLKMMI